MERMGMSPQEIDKKIKEIMNEKKVQKYLKK